MRKVFEERFKNEGGQSKNSLSYRTFTKDSISLQNVVCGSLALDQSKALLKMQILNHTPIYETTISEAKACEHAF